MCSAVGCAEHGQEAHASRPRPRKQWNGARATVMISLAKDQYESGNFDKCRETINEATAAVARERARSASSPRSSPSSRRSRVADRELRLARQFDPRNPEADYLSGVVYQRWQKPELAYEFYSQACEKAPTELAYPDGQGRDARRDGAHPRRCDCCRTKVVYFEHSAAIRDAVGQLLLQEKKYAEAVAMIREATILTPDDLTSASTWHGAVTMPRNMPRRRRPRSPVVKDENYAKRSDVLADARRMPVRSWAGSARPARAYEAGHEARPGHRRACGWA